MRFILAKCCFWKADKIKMDFENMKRQVKMHEKMLFILEKKEVTLLLLLGYPFALYPLEMLLLEGTQNRKAL